mmetsp:Transcript_132921/g.230989  ORF Transcript_132921/g.230989 Transcript_132921/m.230989 type:complete len:302 (+) Transcript_132921:48-953(+)
MLPSSSGHRIEDRECAICFEAVAEATVLPCACNVDYCARCWDRALAQSFNSCGHARCPTCRGPVCVDYDSEKCGLVFSPEAKSPSIDSEGDKAGADKQAAMCETMQKLREQALPTQLKHLRDYGGRHPHIKDIAGSPDAHLRNMSASALKLLIDSVGGSAENCLEKEELVCQLEKAGQGEVVCSILSEAVAECPTCVCGSSLEWVSGRERTKRACEVLFPGVPLESERFQILQEMFKEKCGSACFCDLCSCPLPCSSGVWTCKNGNSTILHATAYDVCSKCFVRHACAGDDMYMGTHSKVA